MRTDVERKKSKSIALLVLGIILTVSAIAGVTYAFFATRIVGTETGTTVTLTAGSMTITYSNGDQIITEPNIFPQMTPIATKNFTVACDNTSTDEINYTLALTVNTNTFSPDAISYKMTSTNTGGSGTVVPSITSDTGVATGPGTTTLGNGTFVPGTTNIVHTYALEFFFLDTLVDQSDDMGASFEGRISVYETTP